ncbi:MAG TPA: glycine/sarcosine/betaine reductase selenoprotein B family protein [Nitrospirota bacterium]|nr:glycine/sarcosine/betaine reductase selenoprotein B family protein [Nitrospirota bacterium]
MSFDSYRIKNKIIAKIVTRFPNLAKKFIDSYDPWNALDTPWTAVSKALSDSKIAFVTTAGVHHTDQTCFDMRDPEGDPSYRLIDLKRPISTLMITHDYYDHTDADRDINIVFPIERLKEFEKEGIIGRVADIHYSFMGHIIGRHISTLVKKSAPEVARKLKEDHVDVVLLAPG